MKVKQSIIYKKVTQDLVF